MKIKKGGEIIIYKNRHGKNAVDVRLENEAIWLSQKQMAELFDKDVRTVNEHIVNVFKERELDKNQATIRKFRIVQKEGEREVERHVEFYNLDVIISVGYRVKSIAGTNFRIWATKILKEFAVKGYVINRDKVEHNFLEFEKDYNSIVSLLPTDKNLDNKSILELVKTFADTWLSLDAYDRDELVIQKVTKRKVKLTAEELVAAIAGL